MYFANKCISLPKSFATLLFADMKNKRKKINYNN